MSEWKLVPVEPTAAMLRAAFRLDLSYMPTQESADRAAIYRAMLDAAPVPTAADCVTVCDAYAAENQQFSAELARLRAENKRLKALLREASGHVAPDTGWSYDEPTGYLLDRIDAAMAQGKV